MSYLIHTERLFLREFLPTDAAFILALINTKGWLAFIGDKQIHTIEKAAEFINYLSAPYASQGFGLWLVALPDGTPIGMCGLVKRDSLAEADLGFAFLPAYEGKGYAQEAAIGCLEYAYTTLGLPEIWAITLPENQKSIRLLHKLGFVETERVQDKGEELLLLKHRR